MTFEEWYNDNWPRLTGGRFKDGIKEAWQAAQAASAEEIKRLKAKLVPQDERIQEIKRLLAAQAAQKECVTELLDYAQHDSWRCGYNGECHCGLNAITERYGLPAVPLPEKGDAK